MMFASCICVLALSMVNAGKDPILGQDSTLSPQQLPSDEMFFGDVVLNEKQKHALKHGKNMGGMKTNGNAFAAVKGVNLRWTNAVIPYEIDCSLENLEDAVDAIQRAMKEWEAKTCIRFVKRTNEQYHLKFFRDTHCWGNVGMTSYTKISVGYGCEYQHVMTHEIGHVVGFYHEQNRKDRDNYVKVHWENIGRFKDAFDIVKNTDSLGVPYDYESIMHYPWNAFSSNGKDTMSPKQNVNGKTPYIALSLADAEQTSKMYNCPAVERRRAAARKERHVGHLDVVKRSIDECIDKNVNCPVWARDGHCSKSSYMTENCKLSCGSPSCKGTDCVDQYADCKSWAEINHCTINPTVARVCQKSCNKYCQGTVPTKTPPTQRPPTGRPPTKRPTKTSSPTSKPSGKFLGKGVLCKDLYNQCAEWARTGECESNPGWMMKSCMKSCKSTSCDDDVKIPPGQCAKPLGLSRDINGNSKIPDSAFSSSSYLAPGGGWKASAMNARLYMSDDHDNKRIGAWCTATYKASNDYLQVDLGQRKTIRYIATQGRDQYFERVDSFKIQYSDDGRNFQTYKATNGHDKVFEGNCDHVTPVLNEFTNQIQARYIRYVPVSWNYPCVRMELYGC